MAGPFPEGRQTVVAHLVIKGAERAIDFYKAAFGAEEVSRMPFPGKDGGTKVGHAELRFGESQVFVAEESPDWGSLGPTPGARPPVTIHLNVVDADAAFDRAVKAGAQVVMPLSNMFWGDRYGQVVDPAGHYWSIAQHLEAVAPDVMQKRMEAMFARTTPCE